MGIYLYLPIMFHVTFDLWDYFITLYNFNENLDFYHRDNNVTHIESLVPNSNLSCMAEKGLSK